MEIERATVRIWALFSSLSFLSNYFIFFYAQFFFSVISLPMYLNLLFGLFIHPVPARVSLPFSMPPSAPL